MKFKTTCLLLTLYSLIALGITLHTGFESNITTALFVLFYVIIPAFGAYAALVKNRVALVVAAIFFISQIVRSVSAGSVFPNIAPITISFPMGDFSKGSGYLIDFFAIFMVVLLVWLISEVSTNIKTP